MVKEVVVITMASIGLATSAALAQVAIPPANRAPSSAAAAAASSTAASQNAPSRGDLSPAAEGLILSALSVYTPPSCVPGVPFSDINCTSGFDAWIEQFGRDGISSGCGGGNYCPGTAVTRDQMAVFIERAMRGTGNWPPHTVLVYHHPMGEANSNVNSGNELLSLVAGIPGGGPEAPANGNPWVVKLGPGTWDLGSATLFLPGWVSIEGSGVDETMITSATTGTSVVLNISSGVTTLTRLTVQNFGGSGTGAYVVQMNGGRLVLDRTELFATASATYQVGIYANDSAVEMYNESGSFASGGTSIGIYTAGSQYHALTIDHSVVEGLSDAIDNAAGYEVDMAYDGVFDAPLANFSPGVFKCIGNYDRNMSAVTCP